MESRSSVTSVGCTSDWDQPRGNSPAWYNPANAREVTISSLRCGGSIASKRNNYGTVK
jgi:hypothetical protein